MGSGCFAGGRAFPQAAASVELTISTPKTDYYAGELIPLELKFTTTVPKRFVADSREGDRIGRLNGVEQYVVEPANGVEDPLAGLMSAMGGMGGLSGGQKELSQNGFVLERVLNEYVRFRRPGEFRISVRSRRVSEVENPAELEGPGLIMVRGKEIEVVSNVLTVSIRQMPAAWAAQQAAAARAVLAGPQGPNSNAAAKDRRSAISLLLALGTVEAALELARSSAADVAEQRLAAADQGITERQIDVLGQLAVMVESGPIADYPADRERQKEWQDDQVDGTVGPTSEVLQAGSFFLRRGRKKGLSPRRRARKENQNRGAPAYRAWEALGAFPAIAGRASSPPLFIRSGGLSGGRPVRRGVRGRTTQPDRSPAAPRAIRRW